MAQSAHHLPPPLGKALLLPELPFPHTSTSASTWESLPFYMTLTTVTDQEVIPPLSYARNSRHPITTVIGPGMGMYLKQAPGTLQKEERRQMLKSSAPVTPPFSGLATR